MSRALMTEENAYWWGASGRSSLLQFPAYLVVLVIASTTVHLYNFTLELVRSMFLLVQVSKWKTNSFSKWIYPPDWHSNLIMEEE